MLADKNSVESTQKGEVIIPFENANVGLKNFLFTLLKVRLCRLVECVVRFFYFDSSTRLI